MDLNHAAGLVTDAESLTGEPAVRAASAALRVLDGEVLPEQPDTPWVEPARAWHHGLLRRTLHALAGSALDVGAFETARSAAEAAVLADSFDETAWRLLMRTHHAVGESARAVLTYERLRTTLATELGIDPAPATRDLHLFILRGAALSRSLRSEHQTLSTT